METDLELFVLIAAPTEIMLGEEEYGLPPDGTEVGLDIDTPATVAE